MIPIKKQSEPKKLTTYKSNKKNVTPSYDTMPHDVHEAVLQSLIQEQGGICAYCMCRIPQKIKKHSLPATIEHIDPRSDTDAAKTLDYNNMLAVCSGNRNPNKKKEYELGEDRLTCDAHRNDATLTVNPLIASTLLTIAYKSDGTIYSKNKKVNTDLNDTLNLNCKTLQLPESRKEALIALTKKISSEKKDIKLFVQRTLKHYLEDSPKPPYVGILIYWLKRKAVQLKIKT